MDCLLPPTGENIKQFLSLYYAVYAQHLKPLNCLVPLVSAGPTDRTVQELARGRDRDERSKRPSPNRSFPNGRSFHIPTFRDLIRPPLDQSRVLHEVHESGPEFKEDAVQKAKWGVWRQDQRGDQVGSISLSSTRSKCASEKI